MLTVTAAAVPSRAGDIPRWLNQSIYVPLYSHIYADDRYKDKPFALTATLSIRNTDPAIGLILDSVDYYDSQGKKNRVISRPQPKSTNWPPIALLSVNQTTKAVPGQNFLSPGIRTGQYLLLLWNP